MSEEKQLSFEEAYRELEATVHRLEDGSLALEEAIALYERGMRLAQHCNAALDTAELQVQQLALATTLPGSPMADHRDAAAVLRGNQQQAAMFFEAKPEA